MTEHTDPHQTQVDFWSGPGGGLWASAPDRFDASLATAGAAALSMAAAKPGESVLDVGCGAGFTTLQLAHQVGPTGDVTGLDVSPALLDVARARDSAGLVDWQLADAATAPLQANHYDLLFSRFGVMFFGDSVAAFTHLHLALRSGGRVVFVCWRTGVENPWVGLPLKAVMSVLPDAPAPNGQIAGIFPGMFAFGDPAYVTTVLMQAGFTKPSFSKLDFPMDLAAGQGFEAAVHRAIDTGPARALLLDRPDSVRDAALDAVRTALHPFLHDANVMLPGACWLVQAAKG